MSGLLALAPGGMAPMRRHATPAAAVVAALALHAWWLAPSPPGAIAPARPVAIQTRLVIAPAPKPAAVSDVATMPELAPIRSPTAVEPDVAAASTPPPAQTLPALPAAAPPAEAASPWSDDDTYLPRQALTDAPQAAGPVLLDYPPDAPAGRWRATLTLFIDSDGQVRRVRIDDGALPAVLQAQAREAFLAARFSPGRIDGRAVRARLRVEVEFAADTAREMGVPRPVP